MRAAGETTPRGPLVTQAVANVAAAKEVHAMRINARLPVVDGQVACPRSGERECLGHCLQCIDFELIDASDATRFVIACRPDVDSFGDALDRVIRA
jgi:hypothetical protein